MAGDSALERRLHQLEKHRAELARLQAARTHNASSSFSAHASAAPTTIPLADISSAGLEQPSIQRNAGKGGIQPVTKSGIPDLRIISAKAKHSTSTGASNAETGPNPTPEQHRDIEDDAEHSVRISKKVPNYVEQVSAKIGALMGELEFDWPDDQPESVGQNATEDVFNQSALPKDQAVLRKARNSSLLDARWTEHRRVSAIHWHSEIENILLVAYGLNRTFMDSSVRDADGVVAVWDSESGTLQRSLLSTAPLTSLTSHSLSPALVICGTCYGDIVAWDTRSRSRSPSLYTRTESSAPISGLQAVGTASPAVLSTSQDGVASVWNLSNLSSPVEAFAVRERGIRDIRISAFAFPKNSSEVLEKAQNDEVVSGGVTGEHTAYAVSKRAAFLVCGEDGGIYRVESDGERWNVLPGMARHDSPATGISCHPGNPRYPHLANIAITSSLDWSLCLWSMGRRGPCLPLQKFAAYDLHANNDVHWNPSVPGVFAVGDSGGGTSVFDISNPMSDMNLGRFTWSDEDASLSSSDTCAITRVCWNRKGDLLASGTAHGAVQLWQASQTLSDPNMSSWEDVSATVKFWHDSALSIMSTEKELPNHSSYVFHGIPPIVNPHYMA